MRAEADEIAGRPVLVFTPERHIRVGASRLEELRRDPLGSDVDNTIARAVRAADPPCKVLILRGGDDDGHGSWRFEETLREEECAELGYLLLRSQLPMYRELVRLGVLMFAKVEWGPREAAGFDAGRHRLLAELERERRSRDAGPSETARRDLDAWMIRHITFWSLGSLDDSRALLERTIPRIASRRAHVARLLAQMRER